MILLIVSTVILMIAQSIIDILGAISGYFGLDITSLLGIAVGITIVVNFLKATPPFNNWIQGNVIPIITFILSLLVSAFVFWGLWVQLIVASVIIAVLSIGGWATAKMIAHKVGKEPTSIAGGKKV